MYWKIFSATVMAGIRSIWWHYCGKQGYIVWQIRPIMWHTMDFQMIGLNLIKFKQASKNISIMYRLYQIYNRILQRRRSKQCLSHSVSGVISVYRSQTGTSTWEIKYHPTNDRVVTYSDPAGFHEQQCHFKKTQKNRSAVLQWEKWNQFVSSM